MLKTIKNFLSLHRCSLLFLIVGALGTMFGGKLFESETHKSDLLAQEKGKYVEIETYYPPKIEENC